MFPVTEGPEIQSMLLGRNYQDGDARVTWNSRCGRADAALARGHVKPENEDALLVRFRDDTWLALVADGHLGHAASHELTEAFARAPAGITGSPMALGHFIEETLHGATPQPEAGTTLTVCALDMRRRELFGYSWGDSTAAILRSGKRPRVLTNKNGNFIRLDESIPPPRPQTFSCRIPFESTLLLYTDGVDECHYRHPGSSIRIHHIQNIYERARASSSSMAEQLLDAALDGLSGMPGGEDNIAILSITPDQRAKTGAGATPERFVPVGP